MKITSILIRVAPGQTDNIILETNLPPINSFFGKPTITFKAPHGHGREYCQANFDCPIVVEELIKQIQTFQEKK